MSEVRLIDANKLEPDTEWDEYGDGFMSYSQIQIDNAPTVDAVPVVRCFKCNRHEKIDGKKGVYCHRFCVFKSPNGYCDCGAKIDESISCSHENDEVSE